MKTVADYRYARHCFCSLFNKAALTATYRLPGYADCSTDVMYFGPVDRGRPAAEKIVVVISGTHGLEGPIGSLVQCKLAKMLPLVNSKVGVVLVHALNPWGYLHSRRTDADNIDVNRAAGDNFVTRTAYDQVREIVEPETWNETREAELREQFRDPAEARFLQGAIMGGQYDHAKGLFYGGQRNQCWSVQTLHRIAADFLNQASRIVVIDIHTGLGEYAKGDIYSPAYDKNSDLGVLTGEFFGKAVQFPLASATSGSSSTPVSGDILSALIRFLPNISGKIERVGGGVVPEQRVIPIAVELGTTMTVPELTTVMIAENFIFHHPGVLPKEYCAQIQTRLKHGFFPETDLFWIGAAWNRCRTVFESAVVGLGK